MPKLILEAPVFTVEAALKASAYGIDRLELCSDFGEGGETPSAGALAFLKEKTDVPVFVMVRPRGGDFVYTSEELEVMKKDIRILGSLGADGFVFGVLTPEGMVNRKACEVLLAEAKGLPCTFHRAFDISLNLEKSLETIIECGFSRILTSGGENTVTLGLQTLQKLLRLAGDSIVVMPGGGLQAEHVDSLNVDGLLRELHASCKGFRNSDNRHVQSSVQLSHDPESFRKVLTVDKKLVDRFLEEMRKYD